MCLIHRDKLQRLTAVYNKISTVSSTRTIRSCHKFKLLSTENLLNTFALTNALCIALNKCLNYKIKAISNALALVHCTIYSAPKLYREDMHSGSRTIIKICLYLFFYCILYIASINENLVYHIYAFIYSEIICIIFHILLVYFENCSSTY